MTSSIPAWQPFELYGGWVPSVLDLDTGHDPVEGRVVVISPTRTVRDRGWAPRAAVEMARGWASQGARVFLADLSLHDPEIHAVLEAENLEGVSDSILYGASIQRVARPADDGAFFVATAGTAVADAASVLDHSRWTGMTHGFMTAGVTLVLYLPVGLAGSESILRRGTHRIMLARPGEVFEELGADAHPPVVAVLGPDGTMGEFMDPPLGHAPQVAVGGQGFADPLVRDPLEAAGYAGAEAGGAAVATAPHAFSESDETAAAEAVIEADRRGSGTALVALALVVTAIVVAAALALLGVIDLPFLSAAPGGNGPALETVSEALPDNALTGADLESVVVTSAAMAPNDGEVTLITDLDGGSDDVGEALDARTVAAVASPVSDRANGGTAVGAAGRSPAGAGPSSVPVARRDAGPVAFEYSLSLSAWETLSGALEHVGDWERRRPGHHFVVAPVISGGRLFYRVLGGPAGTLDEVEALRAELGSRFGSAEAAGWILRNTSLAFLLDEADDRRTADAAASAFVARGIPAYVLASDSGSGYKVYAGAYGNAQDAAPLADMLRERGMTPPTLTERTGRLPG